MREMKTSFPEEVNYETTLIQCIVLFLARFLKKKNLEEKAILLKLFCAGIEKQNQLLFRRTQFPLFFVLNQAPESGLF